MSLPEVNPYHQVPTWSSTETFEIQGNELEALYNYFNIVAPAFTAIQQVFARGIQAGKVAINYEDKDGNPVSDEDVAVYTKALNEHFKKKLSEDTPDEQAPSKILNVHGAPTQEG